MSTVNIACNWQDNEAKSYSCYGPGLPITGALAMSILSQTVTSLLSPGQLSTWQASGMVFIEVDVPTSGPITLVSFSTTPPLGYGNMP